ncbi:hypothetical protein PPYR_13398 [Photinus pyralis]|uniref:Uncharacterized protein n=1 Tax=Photinus pyralis TaxID=7054 RepID=A0A5N4A950_PHOPY|nr:hypothetical protein PPYR_13398 [Photinus pyralis]
MLKTIRNAGEIDVKVANCMGFGNGLFFNFLIGKYTTMSLAKTRNSLNFFEIRSMALRFYQKWKEQLACVTGGKKANLCTSKKPASSEFYLLRNTYSHSRSGCLTFTQP